MTCTHYQRKCKLLAPCCNKEYTCRICHDEKEDHVLDRRSVKNVICIQCSKKQEINRNCNECGILFGNYTCLICRLYDDIDKKQFHCDGCGICRVNGKENYFHCPKCNTCLSMSIATSHKCIENMLRKCPVCLEDLQSSREQVDVPPCSHAIHLECRNDMLRHGKSSCPICNQSLIDMKSVWASMDEQIANCKLEMPEIYRNYHVNILCRDCHKESKVLFHVIGLKCSQCGSYNTTRIGGDDPLPEEPPSAVENLGINLDDSRDSETEDDDSDLPNVYIEISSEVLTNMMDGVVVADDFNSLRGVTSNAEDDVDLSSQGVTSTTVDDGNQINETVVMTTYPDGISNDNEDVSNINIDD